MNTNSIASSLQEMSGWLAAHADSDELANDSSRPLTAATDSDNSFSPTSPSPSLRRWSPSERKAAKGIVAAACDVLMTRPARRVSVQSRDSEELTGEAAPTASPP